MIHQRESTTVRQKQIVSAARKIIIKHGSEHVTVRRIAQEVGVSEGAIYRHFKSKRDVLSLLVDDIENTLLSDLKFDAEESYTLESLEKIIRDHMSRVVQRKGVSFQVIAEIISLGDKKLNQKVYDVITRYTGRIKSLLEQGVKSGAIRSDADLDAAAVSFFGMTQGLVGTWALSQYGFDLEQKYESLWKLFREALIKH